MRNTRAMLFPSCNKYRLTHGYTGNIPEVLMSTEGISLYSIPEVLMSTEGISLYSIG